MNEYLFLCTKIRSMEPNLLNEERLTRMLEARSNEDALNVLTECGYGDFADVTPEGIDEVLSEGRRRTMADIGVFVPQPQMVDVFRIRYDYHNIKTILKAEAMDTDPTPLLLDLGTIPAKVLETRMRGNDIASLDYIIRTAIADARETLNTTRDPQLSDFVVDRAYHEHLNRLVSEVRSPFLKGYVEVSIDATNLRTAVRTIRMGKSAEFLRDILFDGGSIDPARILAAASIGGSLADLFALTLLKHAAAEGMEAIKGARLTKFEKLCDNAVTEYLRQAKFVTVGEEIVIAYLAAKESELTAIRIILTGRLSGLDPETIQERLRVTYV